MPVEVTTGEDGDEMTLLKTDKGSFGCPAFSLEAMNNIKTLPLREDDIILCSYAKAGCHWTWEILNCLIHGKMNAEDKTPKEKNMMEFNTHDKLSALPSPRILNNHFHFEDQPADLFKKKPKTIYIYRNIKDIAVSFYYHVTGIQNVYYYTAPFSSFLKRIISGYVENGSVFDYMRGWDTALQNHPEMNVHVMCYETLKRNTLEEVKRLSQYLGTNTDEAFLKSVVEFTNFSSMKQRKGKEEHLMNKEGQHVMYRKGGIGDWKNHFTVAENEMMDQMIRNRLSDLKFHQFIYE